MHLVRWFALFVAGFCSAAALGQSKVTVTLSPTATPVVIPADFSGLSFETARILPDASGVRLFRPDNKRLIALFRSLGIHSLRIGGNTADRATVPIPTTADIDSLFAFAKAADVKVIYTLRLKDSQPGDVTPVAKYLMANYREQISCLAIGNEPNVYAKEYPAYKTVMDQFIAAIEDPAVAPGAVFCGPCSTPNRSDWARRFATDFAAGGHVRFISQHSYPCGDAKKVASVAEGQERLLSPNLQASYQKFYESFGATAVEKGIGFRLGETNNFYNGGALGVSDTYAAALWGLDYLHWWAARGAAGVNLHTSDIPNTPDVSRPCHYAVFTSAPDGSYILRSLAYAVKAFDIAGQGKSLPLSIDNPGHLNLTAYANANNGKLYLTLINKEHGPQALPVTVTFSPGQTYENARQLLLSAPDLSATASITLGNAPLADDKPADDKPADDKPWSGSWTSITAIDKSNPQVVVPSASALILELSH